ncbi:MAG: hypothetical protein SPL82_16430 [Lachnospiraceae bacterium]|nr:hypothetical protein [Lachnospiraceae bacterium]
MRLIDADEKKTRENDSLEKEESYECETDKKKFTTILDELQGDVNLLQSKINEARRFIQKCRSEEELDKIDEIQIEEGYKHIDLFG